MRKIVAKPTAFVVSARINPSARGSNAPMAMMLATAVNAAPTGARNADRHGSV